MFRRESDESPVCSVRISAAAVAGILGTVIALLVLADVAGQISTYYFGHPAVLGLVALFDLDSEANMPSWYSASVLLICSGVLALIATAKGQSRDRVPLALGRSVAWLPVFVSGRRGRYSRNHRSVLRRCRPLADASCQQLLPLSGGISGVHLGAAGVRCGHDHRHLVREIPVRAAASDRRALRRVGSHLPRRSRRRRGDRRASRSPLRSA